MGLTGRYNQYLKPKHKFEWKVEGWEHIDRYGNTIKVPETLGASQPDYEKILAEGIEKWIENMKKSQPLRPILKYNWPFYGSEFTDLGWWL